MLTPYDDLPVHQLATTLDHAGTSDPRFFDRYWFVVYEREGAVALAMGLGVYRNMNVVDAFASAIVGAVQHNARFSRPLRPDPLPRLGPLGIEVREGLRRLGLVCQPGEHGIAFDLEWQADFDPFEEEHHFARVGGVVREDYRRFYQHGAASGFIEVAGQRFESEQFWSFRDRSFGVRPGVGGQMPEPAPDEDERADHTGLGITGRPGLFFGCAFGTDELAATCTFADAPDGQPLKVDGRFVRTGESTVHAFTGVAHDLQFHPGGIIRGGTVQFRAAAEVVHVDLEELTAPLAYPGFGYGRGWHDGRGLGVHRGTVVEVDTYDVAPSQVTDRSGHLSFDRPPMLDQAMRIRANGRPGFMELVAGLLPGHHRYSMEGTA